MNQCSTDNFSGFITKTLKASTFEVLPLAGDASARRYYRVIHGDQSWVLMCWEPYTAETYPFLSVQKHLAKHGVQVPQVEALAPQEGLMLLEDLGDLTLERKFWESQSPELSIPYYQQTLDELLKIHFAATQDKSPCTAFALAFDTEKLLWEMNYAKEHLLQGVLKFNFSAKADEQINHIFTDICQRLDKEPRCISHRDYHSRNVMIKLNKVRIIDFQDARMGTIQYDLVSLFKDSYVQMSDEMAEDLLQYYFAKAKDQYGFTVDRHHFNEIYELQSIQRCFKACGSFASFFNMRQDRRYLRYLTPTLRRLIKSINHFSQYREFAEVLIDSGALEKNYETL